MESMAELMSNSLLLGSYSGDTGLCAFTLGQSQSPLEWGKGQCSQGSGGCPPLGRMNVQTVAEKGDQFNIQKVVQCQLLRRGRNQEANSQNTGFKPGRPWPKFDSTPHLALARSLNLFDPPFLHLQNSCDPDVS